MAAAYTFRHFFNRLDLKISKGLSEGSLCGEAVNTYIHVGKSFINKDLGNSFIPNLERFAAHESPVVNLAVATQMIGMQKCLGVHLTKKHLVPIWKTLLENSNQEVKIAAASSLFQFFKNWEEEHSRAGVIISLLPTLEQQLMSASVEFGLKKILIAAFIDLGQLISKEEANNHLLPCILHLLEDVNPDVRLHVLTKINFMIENKEPEELTDILQAIIEVVKSLQPDLQPPSAWNILVKCDELVQLISTLHTRKEQVSVMMPLIRQLAQSDFIGLKFCAVGLVILAFSKFTKKGKSNLRNIFQNLANDNSMMVRLKVASKLDSFSALLSLDEVKKHILPRLISLLGDQQITVKLAAVEASFDLIKRFPAMEKLIMPVMRMKTANDESVQLRCKIAQRFPQLVESLESQVIIERQLVFAYLSLLQDPEPTVRGVAAAKLADFCYALNRDLRKEAIVSKILPRAKELIISERDDAIRSRMAAAVIDLGPLIGSEMTMEHLMPLFLLLVNDSSPRVQLNFLFRLVRIRNILTFGELNISLIPKILSILRDLELSLPSQLPTLYQSAMDFFRILFHVHGSKVVDHKNFLKLIAADESQNLKILACYLIPTRINTESHLQTVTELLNLFGDLCGSSEEMILLAAASNLKQLVLEGMLELGSSPEGRYILQSIVIPLFVKFANHDKESVRLAVMTSWIEMKELLMSLNTYQENSSPLSLSTLLQCANDVSREIRCMVAVNLPNLLKPVLDHEDIKRDLVPVFLALLRDSDGKVRAAAARGVTEFCNNLELSSLGNLIMEVIFPCVEMLVKDTDPQVKIAIASVIIGLGPMIGVEYIVERLSILLRTLMNDDTEVVASLLKGFESFFQELQLK